MLTSGQASALTQPCSRAFPPGLSGAWDPQPADIARAERRFEAAVDEAFLKLAAEYRQPRPKKYYRQYAGFFRDGGRVLYVNAIAEEEIVGFPDRSWRDRAVRSCDGGTLALGAVFDLRNDEFDFLEFDGTYAGPIPAARDR